MMNKYIFAAQTYPGGEIGRRASLRGWCWQRRGSSNLLSGTMTYSIRLFVVSLSYKKKALTVR